MAYLKLGNLEQKTVINPDTGRKVNVYVEKGTEIWNVHKKDGPATGSWFRGTKEAEIDAGGTKFHVDTNNPNGVIGIGFETIDFTPINIDWTKIKFK